ncbi:hypothetical protein TREES_T100016689 [Tupaia chinensis]|uniref:Uncharacterized protein n=1 Tax=Tupaia chinensis TaxID=246437 RepID=L9L6P7_TUPCH|nr:hypothetical protein TREES_T100016689 [Tupaia chinensis]
MYKVLYSSSPPVPAAVGNEKRFPYQPLLEAFCASDDALSERRRRYLLAVPFSADAGHVFSKSHSNLRKLGPEEKMKALRFPRLRKAEVCCVRSPPGDPGLDCAFERLA